MIYDPYPFKRCSRCGNEFHATRQYFSPDKRGKFGLKSDCKPCRAKLTAGWRAEHPNYYHEYYVNNLEYHHERRKLYYETHQEQLREWSRNYRQRSEVKARLRVYNASHRERHALLQRTFRARHTDYYRMKARQWRAAHPLESNAHHQKRVARQRNLPSAFTVKDWMRALDYFDNCCAVCGRPQGLWHVLAQDHWIPLSHGGHYTPDNIVPLCHGLDGCNNFKKDRDPVEWLKERYGKRKAKTVLRRIQTYFDWTQRDGRHAFHPVKE